MLEINQSIGYSKEDNIVGAIVEFSLLTGKVTLMDEKSNIYKVDIEKVDELQEVGALNGVLIYEHDLLVHKDVKTRMYEIEIVDEEDIRLHRLDNRYQRNGAGAPFPADKLNELFGGTLEFGGNSVLVLQNQEKSVFDFDVAVFRGTDEDSGDVVYFYAGNDKECESITFIEATFFGEKIFDKPFNQFTLPYDDVLVMIANGELKQVEPMQLANYVTGVTYGEDNAGSVITTPLGVSQMVFSKDGGVTLVSNSITIEDTYDELEPEEPEEELFDGDVKDIEKASGKVNTREIEDLLENTCQTCGEPSDECDCVLWGRR